MNMSIVSTVLLLLLVPSSSSSSSDTNFLRGRRRQLQNILSVGPPLTSGCPQIAPQHKDTCTQSQQQKCRYPILGIIDEKAAAANNSENSFESFWTCNCDSQDGKYSCAKQAVLFLEPVSAPAPAPVYAPAPVPSPTPVSSFTEAPVPAPVPVTQGRISGPNTVQQTILNGPINTEADTCPFEPPNSDDTCSGSSAFSWRQCIYAIAGEYNIYWTCNCGADSLFHCAKRG
jgi:hypothetical protein